MPRIALINIFIGFFILFIAAACGAFIATNMTRGYLQDRVILDSWSLMLEKSAHGHSNLFAILHICFGLSMPYSCFSNRIKTWQTIGLSLGTIAMGPLMIWRASIPPSQDLDMSGLAIGVTLSAALIALATHALGLAIKITKRSYL